MSSGGPRRHGGRGGRVNGRGSSITGRGGGRNGGGGIPLPGESSNTNNINRGGRIARRGPGRQRSRGGLDNDGGTSNGSSMRDEDVLIAFMPFLKGNDSEATRIYESYQTRNAQREFLLAARAFLAQENGSQISSTTPQHVASYDTLRIQSNDPNYYSDAEASRPDPPVSFREPQPSTPGQPLSHHESLPVSSQSTPKENATHLVDHGLLAMTLNDPNANDSAALPKRDTGSNGGSIWGSAFPSPITPSRHLDSVPTTEWNDREVITPGPLLANNIQQPLLSDGLLAVTTGIPAATATFTPKREAPQPKRVWTHFDEQVGRILVNGVSGADHSILLPFRPRDELTAHWTLPIDYLMKTRRDPNNSDPITLDQSLKGLTVGLFRRGCTENGGQASIISKEVSGYEYWHDPASKSIRGKVPFFSPRTPGNVLFRMYWETNPIQTVAMGPTLRVRILEQDFESSVRFILSNFKGPRKSNPTSLSSLHSLATVLETHLTRRYESMAARSIWGCVQEARKVVEACYQEYVKTCSKMTQLEEKLGELKKQMEEDDTKSQEVSIDNGEIVSDTPGDLSKVESENALQEKTRALLGGRASCERKWRDCQQVFACILRAILTNPSVSSLLRRDLITRMRIEYELWCPLSEEFAVPVENAETWYQCVDELPQSITADHFTIYQQARVKMQMRTLGFDVNSSSLEDILFPLMRNNPNQRNVNPGAVGVFNSTSGAMGQYYQDLFVDEDRVVLKRELIRQRTEASVKACGAFPPGTEVVIFGSSANGFGSPNSDLDMCLQLPDGTTLSEDDGTGAAGMARLAEHFEKSGMSGVDTARLTARIPIIMYKCPNPLQEGDSDEELHECDLSMHNPLAVLNTSLLRSYAEITPVTRVLAAIIKRWAKARDINSPARHTLSSYGYIIMLLHFLTYHKRTGNGLVSHIAESDGDPLVRNGNKPQATPILPNLQWMDHNWPNMPQGTPYRELSSLPRIMMKHPMKDNTVNTYFCKPNTLNEKQKLQALFPGQDLSLAILLTSFFRYFAFEFDYKRQVVSLHSTAARGVVEREVKAELDGWRNYSAALVIEDPFELDYDIAHVLRGGYYHRIRREFALAYTKIADAASGRPNAWNKGELSAISGKDLIDWVCEPITNEKDQE